MTTAAKALLAALVMALALPACRGAEVLGFSARDELIVYSGRGQNLIGPLLEDFAEQTGISIAVKYGDSAELALLVAEEGDRTPADVFLSQSPGATGFLAGEGRLAKLDREVLDKVDPRFRNEAGRWVGLSGRQRVLVYNTELVEPDELPSSVFELTGEEYAGRVALAPPNGSFQDFVTAMRQLEGDQKTREWLTAMAENGAPTYANNNAIVEAVSRGEVPMGLVNHYYNYRFLEEDPDLPTRNHLFPRDDVGALLIPSTASIIAGTDKPEEANRLIEFLLSEDAQQFYSGETFEYPLAAGVEPSADLPPLETLKTPTYDFDRLGGGLEKTVELIRSSGLEGA